MNLDRVEIAKSNILIVDDTPANLNLLTQMLSGQGYKVRVAPGGKLALTSAQSNPPDLILLDINMPHLNGYQVCEQLKQDRRTCDIPVIFISALDEAINKVTAFEVGGVDYITKPFELAEVLARVESQLRLRHYQLQLRSQNDQLQLLLTTTQIMGESADVDSALQAILANVCQSMGWDFGEVWTLNLEGTGLACSSVWYSGDAQLSTFYEQTQSCSLIAHSKLPGRIWLSKKPVWIEDLVNDSEGVCRSCILSQSFGLKAALGVPILLEGQVLAALLFFRKQSITLDQRSLALVNAVAAQLGAMIQRKQSEAALRQANLELERLATCDGLTQVANRRYFDKYLLQEWERAQRAQQFISLILVDVDYFKRYNDCYGHLEGDACLRRLAATMQQVVKRSADIVARYGGEEFAVILPNTNRDGAMAVAQGIYNAVQLLQLPHAQSKISSIVTLSLGVASLLPNRHWQPDDLITTTDKALYAAKHQGRDRIVALG